MPLAERQRQMAKVRAQLATLLEGISRDLLARHGGVRVELTLVAHIIAEPQLVMQGVGIDDARWYVELPLGWLDAGESWTYSSEFDAGFERVSP